MWSFRLQALLITIRKGVHFALALRWRPCLHAEFRYWLEFLIGSLRPVFLSPRNESLLSIFNLLSALDSTTTITRHLSHPHGWKRRDLPFTKDLNHSHMKTWFSGPQPSRLELGSGLGLALLFILGNVFFFLPFSKWKWKHRRRPGEEKSKFWHSRKVVLSITHGSRALRVVALGGPYVKYDPFVGIFELSKHARQPCFPFLVSVLSFPSSTF